MSLEVMGIKPLTAFRWIAQVAATGACAIGALGSAYLGVLTVAGARKPRADPHSQPPNTRFVLMVPAHNEELVIAETLQSFDELDYDRSMFDVHVVADNCTDGTAEIVRTSNWHVHERDAAHLPGKGPALNWLFDRLDPAGSFDVVVIVDADSIVDPGFLRAMDRTFRRGVRAAQGFYSVREPANSHAATFRYAALACRHHLRPLGRNRLGASAGLYGNGMAFDRAILRRGRWSGHLVEDAEFQLNLLVRDGIIVTYVPDAKLEAEMPAALGSASSQNERWERGRLLLAKQYLPALFRSIAQTPRHGRLAAVDAIADLLVPPLSVLVSMQAIGLVGDMSAAALGSRFARRRVGVDAMALAVVLAHVVVGVRAVGGAALTLKSLIFLPRMILWKLVLWLRALRPSSTVTWQRTRRNAQPS